MSEHRVLPDAARARGSGWFALLFACLIVLHLCKIGAFIAAGQNPLQGDALSYWVDGQRVVAGDWLLVRDPPEVMRTPGYVLFVAFFQAACGTRALAAAIAAQHLLLFAGSLLACWACWRLTRRKSAVLLCLALSLFCMSSHGVAVNLLSDPLFSFLLTLCAACLIAWFQSPSIGWAAAIGAALGAAILVKPAAQFAWAPLAAAMLLSAGGGKKGTVRGSLRFSEEGLPASRICAKHPPGRSGKWGLSPFSLRLAHAACALIAAGLVVAPWLLRNQVCFGSPSLTKFAGRSLWISCYEGNPADRIVPTIPFADAAATRKVLGMIGDVNPVDPWAVYSSLARHRPEDLNLDGTASGRGYSGIAADDLMLAAAKEGIVAHPGRFIANASIRMVWFWIMPNGTYRPLTGEYVPFGPPRPAEKWAGRLPFEEAPDQVVWRSAWYFEKGWLNCIWYPHPLLYELAAGVTVAAIVVLCRVPEHRAAAMFFGLWFSYFTVISVLGAHPSYRYRMVLEPGMIIMVVTAAEHLRLARSPSTNSSSEPRSPSDSEKRRKEIS